MSTTLAEWFATPLGRYLREREQAYFDQTVADIFGYYALQVGLPEHPTLAQCRMPSRWTLDYDPPAGLVADPHALLRLAAETFCEPPECDKSGAQH